MSKNFYMWLLILLSILGICIFFILAKISTQNSLNVIPSFTFTNLQHKPFGAEEIPEAKNYVILYFSPDCHYCSDEIEDLIKHTNKFNDTYFILISPSSIQELRNYANYLSKKKTQQNNFK